MKSTLVPRFGELSPGQCGRVPSLCLAPHAPWALIARRGGGFSPWFPIGLRVPLDSLGALFWAGSWGRFLGPIWKSSSLTVRDVSSPCAVRRAPCAVRRAPCAVRRSPCAGRREPCLRHLFRRAPCAARRAPCAWRRAPCAVRRRRAPRPARRVSCAVRRTPYAVLRALCAVRLAPGHSLF